MSERLLRVTSSQRPVSRLRRAAAQVPFRKPSTIQGFRQTARPQKRSWKKPRSWCSLAGLPASENESSVTVQVPRANLFDVAALTGLMQAINEGGVS